MWIEKPGLIYFAGGLLYLLLCFAPASTQEAGRDAQALISSMRTDLQLLQVSMQTYKTKINSLQDLIKASQNDLTMSQTDLQKQKILLENSTYELQQIQIQYSELSTTLKNLTEQYRRSLWYGKCKTYGIFTLLAVIAIQTVAITVK